MHEKILKVHLLYKKIVRTDKEKYYQDFKFFIISDKSVQKSCEPNMMNKICLSFLFNAFLERFLNA